MWGTLWRPSPSGQELAWVLRQAATLLQAGVPLIMVLYCLREGRVSASMAAALRSIVLALEEGDALSRALARFPALFPADMRLALAAAEDSGQLAPTLGYLANLQEGRVRMAAKVRQALIYPCMTLLTGVVVALTVCLTVVPSFRDSFAAADRALPASTWLVLRGTDVVVEYGGWLAAGALLFAGGMRLAWRRHASVRAWLWTLALRVPLWGRLLRQAALARWCRTLWLLLSAGVPLLSALPAASAAANHPYLTRLTLDIARQVREGGCLQQAMAATGFFPPLLLQLVRVGEHSGTLADMFERAAGHFAAEVDETLATLISLLEPLAMLLLGLLCGGLIWSLYLPIFQLGETVM
ncbi:MAG: type II secretion system F family protein [Paludibacterium sp.]|uniref:type II secretion system F family protein n=1 Tax=Paludibacterium sp. TaxID=1917523 RepID=UPI0025E7EB96|nr:type II secretion system F family protein [Paludibacterium sp.]MBV8046597.1 type II secretion system F family protein [Paludibacterium sp.]MBV8646028.1 type II secretion system F family protein [Paludibacterium sp.]